MRWRSQAGLPRAMSNCNIKNLVPMPVRFPRRNELPIVALVLWLLDWVEAETMFPPPVLGQL